MTNKEAIELLDSIIPNPDVKIAIQTEIYMQAIDLAIKALKLADCPQLQAECKACGGAFCDGEEETT